MNLKMETLRTRALQLVVGAAALILPVLNSAPSSAAAPLAVDFTDYRGGPVNSWLQSKGFTFERDAKSADKVALHADQRGLAVETLKPAQGLLINNLRNLNAYSAVEIEWGVSAFPRGASYERRVNNEAIMVHVFLGDRKVSSGSMFAPDLPYFVGLFLCSGDKVGHPYVGRYYQEGGRYVCLGTPGQNQTVVSRFDLKQAAAMFGTSAANIVSAFTVSVDTSSTDRSSAFIKRIRFVP
jgi:hypothetical protein